MFDNLGKEIKKVDLSDAVFTDEHINEALMQQYVVMYLANQRYAIACTKNRGEVKRSGKKLYKQKGTGNARVGDAGSPVRRKG
ncbi:MAG: 50S ribosomal protein L4 [Candidatus Peribacteria bacterium]|nr:MAG: 50S ribosomal protein L4 [Candidatus Peribacteria bacterium]